MLTDLFKKDNQISKDIGQIMTKKKKAEVALDLRKRTIDSLEKKVIKLQPWDSETKKIKYMAEISQGELKLKELKRKINFLETRLREQESKRNSYRDIHTEIKLDKMFWYLLNRKYYLGQGLISLCVWDYFEENIVICHIKPAKYDYVRKIDSILKLAVPSTPIKAKYSNGISIFSDYIEISFPCDKLDTVKKELCDFIGVEEKYIFNTFA